MEAGSRATTSRGLVVFAVAKLQCSCVWWCDGWECVLRRESERESIAYVIHCSRGHYTLFVVPMDTIMTIRYSLFTQILYVIDCSRGHVIHCSPGHYTLFIVPVDTIRYSLSIRYSVDTVRYSLSIRYSLFPWTLYAIRCSRGHYTLFIVPVDTIRYSLFTRTLYAIHCSHGHYTLFIVHSDTIRYLMFPWILYAIQCSRGHYKLFIVPVDTIRYSLFPWTLYVIHKPLGECPRNQDFQSPIFPRPLTVFTGHSLHSFILKVLPSVTPSAFVVLCLVRPDPGLRPLTC